MARIVMGFHPSVLYRPVPGLVALFARGGGKRHRVRQTLGCRTPTPMQPAASLTSTWSKRRWSAVTSVATTTWVEMGRGLVVRCQVFEVVSD
jgi:hypothetical protein